MAIILRIDVDNPYGYQTFLRKALNYLALNYDFPKIERIGYLQYLKQLLEDLEERDVPATFFFKATTIPKKETRLRILKMHEVGFHAVRTESFQEFLKDFQKVNNAFKGLIFGLSKHGSGEWVGERSHTSEYDPERCIQYAKRLGLKYFSGNGEDPRVEAMVVDGIVYYPSAFWVNRRRRKASFTIEWLVDESERRDVVVLLHPYEWAVFNSVKQDYERIISKGNKFRRFTKN